MKVLRDVKPTAEQLPIISNPTAGVVLIRGAAGSGKTTTAMLMLKQQALFWTKRNKRMQINKPACILVLTFNRTLRGYVGIRVVPASGSDQANYWILEKNTLKKDYFWILGRHF